MDKIVCLRPDPIFRFSDRLRYLDNILAGVAPSWHLFFDSVAALDAGRLLVFTRTSPAAATLSPVTICVVGLAKLQVDEDSGFTRLEGLGIATRFDVLAARTIKLLIF